MKVLRTTILGLLLLLPVSASAIGERVLLVLPEATAQYKFPDFAADQLKVRTHFWEDQLKLNGYGVDKEGEDILAEPLTGYSFIVLPNTMCLSEKQIDGLESYLDEGGNVLMMGGIGSRSPSGTWRGYEFLESVLGSTPIELPAEKNTARALQLRHGAPGTLSSPPGYYVRFTVTDEIVLFIPETDNLTVSGYWATDGYHVSRANEIPRDAGFVTTETESQARIAWIGTNLYSVHQDDVNAGYYDAMFHELFMWLHGNMVAAKHPWPEKYKSAVLIHGDIEDKFVNARHLVNRFKMLEIPTTYNLLMVEAINYPELVEEMAKTSSELSIHGDDHSLFGGQPLEVQRKRLQRASEMLQAFGDRPWGFRPPELSYDDSTFIALELEGYKYMTADNIPDRHYPRFHFLHMDGLTRHGIVTFPKGELDDYDLFARFQFPNPAEMERQILMDQARIKDLGGLYMLNYHSQYLARKEFLNMMESVSKDLKEQEDIWIATALQISDWILLRENLHLSTRYEGESVILSVKNLNQFPTETVLLDVLPPKGARTDQIVVKEVSQNCTYDADEKMFYLYVPPLAAGEIFTVTLGKKTGLFARFTGIKHFWTTLTIFIFLGVLFLSWSVWYFILPKKKIQTGKKHVEIKNYLPVPTVPKAFHSQESEPENNVKIKVERPKIRSSLDMSTAAAQPAFATGGAGNGVSNTDSPISEQESASGFSLRSTAKFGGLKSSVSPNPVQSSQPERSTPPQYSAPRPSTRQTQSKPVQRQTSTAPLPGRSSTTANPQQRQMKNNLLQRPAQKSAQQSGTDRSNSPLPMRGGSSLRTSVDLFNSMRNKNQDDN
ncbi:polysaccharide deacetylase family protein [bacterium]|nr:polysaccharide deacetylase family protein [bacterium]